MQKCIIHTWFKTDIIWSAVTFPKIFLAREHTVAHLVGYNLYLKTDQITVEGFGLVLMHKLKVTL